MADTLNENPLKVLRLQLKSSQGELADTLALILSYQKSLKRDSGVGMSVAQRSFLATHQAIREAGRHPPDALRFIRRLERDGIECRWDTDLWPALFMVLKELHIDGAKLQQELTQWGARQARLRAKCKKQNDAFYASKMK